MNTKLDNITTQYRKFNENQALTEGQLNEFIDYFEDQDRLSRTRLSGVGIVCGFKSTLDGNSITITQGAGVTTDGDLITLRQNNDETSEVSIGFESKTYSYYRQYIDTLQYPHFYKDGQQIPLVELLTEEEYLQLTSGNLGDSTIYPLNLIDLVNKIVILYLESYSNEESPCQDADCDNNGAEQVSNLKVLLTDPGFVEVYMVNGDAKDSIYRQHNSYEDLYDTLQDIEARRVILNTSITTASQLKGEFQDAIQAYNTIADLSTGFTAIAGTFNVNLNLAGQTLENRLRSLLNTTAPNLDDYQYRYDLLKDLIDTYKEIKGLLLHLKAECCPGIASFPKHLMLGTVGAPLELGDHTLCRHDFYNSPMTTNDDENYERVLLLARRFVQKIQNFQSFIGPIKITPSNMNVTLGEKAIPYYYDVTGELLQKWNFDKTQADKAAYNLSYHTANLAGNDFVQHPLYYNIDDNDFYRIEGVVGLPYTVALQNINDLKAQYGLAFDAITLVLQKGKTTGGIKKSEIAPAPVSEAPVISVKELRSKLLAISSDISNQVNNPQRTLQTISGLDNQLKLLNAVKNTGIVKENPKDDVVSELLSDFIERKSGLEHYAGVEPGGTYVMVYESETNNKVLADFALPYLCCSKKDPVFLALPVNKLCSNDEPIVLAIIPLDGEVKAYVNDVQIPVITQAAGQNFFDPALVGSSYLGQPISFTVNDDPIDAQMTVYGQPNIAVTTGPVTYGEVATNPTATVVFKVTGNLTGLTYSWNFGDGTITSTIPANGEVSHTYSLVAGREDLYNPTLTVTNANHCSTQYAITPLKLIGQTTSVCLANMDIIVQYNDRLGPCPGGHTCDSASFYLRGNAELIGNVYLSNTNGSNDHHNYPPGETSGNNRYNTFKILPALAQQIAATSSDGFITFSLVCALNSCHTGLAWTTIKLNGNIIYDGCPKDNFLTINPCTGQIKK